MASDEIVIGYASEDEAAANEVCALLDESGLPVRVWDWSGGEADEEALAIDARMLVLCLNGSRTDRDWAPLEGVLLARQSESPDKRVIVLRLGDELEARLDRFPDLSWVPHLSWASGDRGASARTLLALCEPSSDEKWEAMLARRAAMRTVSLWNEPVGQSDFYPVSTTPSLVDALAFSPNGSTAFVTRNGVVSAWDIETGTRLAARGYPVRGKLMDLVAVGDSLSVVVAASGARPVVLRDLYADGTTELEGGQDGTVTRVSPDGRHLAAGFANGTVRLWDLDSRLGRSVPAAGPDPIQALAWNPEQEALAVASGASIGIYRLDSPESVQLLGNFGPNALDLDWSPDGRRLLSGFDDGSVAVWDTKTARCLAVLEGHQGPVRHVLWRPDSVLALSGSDDSTLRLWNTETGRCQAVFAGHSGPIVAVGSRTDPQRVLSADHRGTVCEWNLAGLAPSSPAEEDRVFYTNAKVLIVGDSGVGKTGLAIRLVQDTWRPTDSTVGAWATQWPIKATEDGADREIWLWDFGGQADQRLVHQLFMEDAALVVVAFDGQRADLFESLAQWDRDVAQSSKVQPAKLLVAARTDAGRPRVSASVIEDFASKRGFAAYRMTSAKMNEGCDELRSEIVSLIPWETIPWRSSPRLFKELKDEIVGLRDEGRVLLRLTDLRDVLLARMRSVRRAFSLADLRAVIGLLEGPGAVWELDFGGWVLLQPEVINAYAQAVIRTVREDIDARGCVSEEKVLRGELSYASDLPRLVADDERIVLLAMHETLVRRGLCIREQTAHGYQLVFPAYFGLDRPDIGRHPSVVQTFRFTGPIDQIYATLVVRMHHTDMFEKDTLWRNAADFKSATGAALGVMLAHRSESTAQLDVYFSADVSSVEQILFSRYVYQHLRDRAFDVVRLRSFVCPACGKVVADRDLAAERLAEWTVAVESGGARAPKHPSILCVHCEGRIDLWDDLEQAFASSAVRDRVAEMRREAEVVLDNESKGRVLVGDVISTVAQAGQISREVVVSDHGIDMEIEFKSDDAKATGKRLYLQLKSGDSHLQTRASGRRIFTIRDPRHAAYWAKQPGPVMLVVRNASGYVEWMDISSPLRMQLAVGLVPRKLTFSGERFTVSSVLKWREKALTIGLDEGVGPAV